MQTRGASTAFLSYSREDSDFALRLAEDLRSAGASVWLDQLDIVAGQRWDNSVQDALTNCQHLIVILSPASVKSSNVMDEVSFALEEGRTVVPVMHRDCTVPFRVRRLQYVDFRRDYARGLQDLLKTLGSASDTASSKPARTKGPSQSHIPEAVQLQRTEERAQIESGRQGPSEQPERAGTKPDLIRSVAQEKSSNARWTRMAAIILTAAVGLWLAYQRVERASSFNSDSTNKNDELAFPGKIYNFEDRQQQDVPAGVANIHILNGHGGLNLTASTDEQIHVAIHKQVTAASQEEADKANVASKPQITVSGGEVTLDSNTQGDVNHRIATNLDVSVPPSIPVVISTRHGDVSVVGRDGDARISCQRGGVSVHDIEGMLNLDLDHASADVSQVGSDVTVGGHADEVSLKEIKGVVNVNVDFTESVKLAKIAKGVSIRTGKTDMQFARLDGSLEMDSDELTVNGVTGPIRLQAHLKDIRITGFSGNLHLQNENGTVEVDLNKPSTIQVGNQGGDIRVYLPDKTSFQVDAHAQSGSIESDFKELNVNNSGGQGVASGSVGLGGPRLTLTNAQGAIEIHKGSKVSRAPDSTRLQ